MIISDKQISPPSLAWSFTFTKSYTDEFQRQYSWKEYPWRNSTDAQSFVFAVISFLSQIIVFPLFQLHWHTFPHPKTKEKQKLPDIKNQLQHLWCLMVKSVHMMYICLRAIAVDIIILWPSNCISVIDAQFRLATLYQIKKIQPLKNCSTHLCLDDLWA